MDTQVNYRDLPDGHLQTKSVAVVLLAAGRASRMGAGGHHKLLAEFDGVPLIRRSALVALGSSASSVTVVSGNQRARIESAILGLPVNVVRNPDYASGMATSLVTGFSTAVVQEASGVLIMLADMPKLLSRHLDGLISVFHENGGRSIVRAVSDGKQGNPVILPQSLMPAVVRLRGDTGARQIIETSNCSVIGVEIGDAALVDVDTPDAVIAAGGVLAQCVPFVSENRRVDAGGVSSALSATKAAQASKTPLHYAFLSSPMAG